MIKKTVLITGASGYIGKNLCEQLEGKYNLLAPRRKELNLLDQKMVDDYFKKNKIDVVIHCAGVGGNRKEEETLTALRENLKIFLNLIKNKNRYKKIIQLGSGAEYDKSKLLVKVKEIDFGKSIPENDYSLFKYISAKIIENLNNVISLRIFGLFGKYEDYRLRFISNSIWRNLNGLPIIIRKNVYFDYLYIDDFIKILDHFINHKAKYKFYNVGTGSKIDLVTIANILNSIADKKSKIVVKNPGMDLEYTCDINRLKKEVKNLQFTDIKEAISRLYAWYKQHLKELSS